MGRSKKAPGALVEAFSGKEKCFCFFCDKEFEDDRHLVNHQLNKHFRCPECRTGSSGRCNTLHGLIIHYKKVHNAELRKTPGALPGRDDPIAHMQVFSMRNVPEDILEEWRNRAGALYEDSGFAPEGPPLPVPVPVRIPLPEEAPPPIPAIPGGGLPAMPGAVFGLGSLATPTPLNTSGPSGLGGLGELSAPVASIASALPNLEGSASVAGMLANLPDFKAGKQEPAEQDWSQQVAQWMSQRKRSEELESPPEFEEPEIPAPANVARSAPPPLFEQPARMEMPEPVPPPVQFTPQPLLAQNVQKQKKQVQSVVAGLVADALGNWEAARRTASVTPPVPTTQTMQWAVPAPQPGVPLPAAQASQPQAGTAKERSPSGSRSAPPTFESHSICITSGYVPTRLGLKREMERFGRVQHCHTGNRQNPVAEPPWVRFEKTSAVDAALKAINSGQVLFDGNTVTAEKMRDTGPKGGGKGKDDRRDRSPKRNDLEVTSRDLVREDRRNERKRDEWYNEDRRVEDRRGPMGPGNFSSRDLFLQMRGSGGRGGRSRSPRRSCSRRRSRSRRRR